MIARPALIPVVLGLTGLALAGCRVHSRAAEDAQPIDLAAFAGSVEPGRGGGAARPVLGTDDRASWLPLELLPAPEAEAEVEAEEDAVFDGPTLEPGEQVLVDSLVGQVNGRPIFADAFFEPISDRLRALAAESSPRAFAAEAAQIVIDELRQEVINALFLAEAEAQLTTEQRKGIRAWLRQVEEQVIAGYGGSKARAQSSLAEEGQTLDTHMEGLKDRALVAQLLQDRIQPRIIVSWRDIEREYKRRYAEFNPPGTITLARIRLATERQAALIADVDARIAMGEDFLEIAEDVNPRGGGKWQEFEVESGNPADIEFTNETLQAAIATLGAEGDTTAPFAIGRFTWWVNVAVLDHPPAQDLYDPAVQRQLASQLRAARGNEEQHRYINALLERGIYDELDAMAARLIAIAVERYGPA